MGIEDGCTSTSLSGRISTSLSVHGILAVVVIYNCRIEESWTLITLNRSLERISEYLDIVVYDNSLNSDLVNGSVFRKGCFNIHYFHDPSNPGVSKAYNFAASYGELFKKSWLLILDQDTSFPVDTFSKYISAVKNNFALKLFVPVLKLADGRILSPARYWCKRGFGLKKISFGLHGFNHLSPLNSGMMISLDAFNAVGGYDERVRLDFSDFMFIERFRRKFDLFFVVDVVGVQGFSDESTDVGVLNERFGWYCEGARNCERESVWDWWQYMVVVVVRASMLAIRTGDVRFYRTVRERFFGEGH
jgi:rhamnosyltransferase